MINYEKAKRYCVDNISKIENFSEAVADENEVWECHHKNEILMNKTHKELIQLELYYKRPAEELVFLSKEEHKKVHSQGKNGRFKKEQIPWNKGKKIDTSKYKNYGKHKEYHRPPNAREIICVETGKIYLSIKEAAKENNLKSHCGITLCCQGKQETAGGYHWKYNK